MKICDGNLDVDQREWFAHARRGATGVAFGVEDVHETCVSSVCGYSRRLACTDVNISLSEAFLLSRSLTEDILDWADVQQHRGKARQSPHSPRHTRSRLGLLTSTWGGICFCCCQGNKHTKRLLSFFVHSLANVHHKIRRRAFVCPAQDPFHTAVLLRLPTSIYATSYQ